MKKILIFAILLVATLSTGDLYRVSVDTDYGFYKVKNLDNLTSKITYMNNVLNINVGDIIEWQSMDDTETITIVSDRGLFYQKNNELKRTYQTFDYVFNESGEYLIWIAEYPKFDQMIIVSDKNFRGTPGSAPMPKGFGSNNLLNQNESNISIPTNVVSNKVFEESLRPWVLIAIVFVLIMFVFIVLLIPFSFMKRN